MTKTTAMERIDKMLDEAEVLVGYCKHGTPAGFCYDIPGMKRDVKNFAASKSWSRVERMSATDSRAALKPCMECLGIPKETA